MLSEYITSLVDVRFHIVGLHVRAVSVFGKKSDSVCGFLAYFCAVFFEKESLHGFDAFMVFLVNDSFVHKTSSSQNDIIMNSLGPSGGRITPLQQMLASGSGALITSLLGNT